MQIPMALSPNFWPKQFCSVQESLCFQPGQTGSGRLQEKLRCAWGHWANGEEWNQAMENTHLHTKEIHRYLPNALIPQNSQHNKRSHFLVLFAFYHIQFLLVTLTNLLPGKSPELTFNSNLHKENHQQMNDKSESTTLLV